jgi:hypothetical protein
MKEAAGSCRATWNPVPVPGGLCIYSYSSSQPRGAEEKKMKATYIWQMINQVGRYLPFLSYLILKTN